MFDRVLNTPLTSTNLSLNDPFISESCIEIKIRLGFRPS